jgi:hypothetical protein
MREEIQELVKKFEQDYEIPVDAQNLETYWVVTARIPKKEETLHHVHRAGKYITTRNERGSVLIVLNPQISDDYVVENWGEMDTFEDFVKKALTRILEDKNAADEGQAEGCGTSCA